MRAGAALVGALLAAGAASAQEELGGGVAAPYTIVEQDLAGVLREFAAGLGVPVAVDPDVEGTVTALSGSFTPDAFLDRLAARHGLSWFHDGATIHVAPASENRTVVVDLGAVDRAALAGALADMGLSDPRLAVDADDRTGIGVVSGHPRYVEMVEGAYAILSSRPEAAEPERRRPVSVLVIRGGRVGRWNGAYVEPLAGDEAPPAPAPDGEAPPSGD